jgi:ribosomal protein S27AE
MVNQKYPINKICPKCGIGMIFEAIGDNAMGREYCSLCFYEEKEEEI